MGASDPRFLPHRIFLVWLVLLSKSKVIKEIVVIPDKQISRLFPYRQQIFSSSPTKSTVLTAFTRILRKFIRQGPRYFSSITTRCNTRLEMSQPEWKPEGMIETLFERALAGNKWASTNAPTAGARTKKDLPVGDAAFQLYSLATPNGQKVSILLEELGIDYDAHVVNISDGSQFTSGFVAVNPNSKIPAAVDRNGPNGESVNLFESGAIVLYLAEKHQRFMPTDANLRAEVMNWLFWQMGGQGPMTGNFGHFFVYAPVNKIETRDYGVARYGMEVMRLNDVLDRHLATRTYLVGEEYTIADMACFAWFHQLKNYKHTNGVTGAEYLGSDRYINVNAWADRIAARPAVQRGLQVCSFSGVAKPWLVTDEAK